MSHHESHRLAYERIEEVEDPHLMQLDDRIGDAARRRQRISEISVCLRRSRVTHHRSPEGINGRVVVSLRGERDAKVIADSGRIGN